MNNGGRMPLPAETNLLPGTFLTPKRCKSEGIKNVSVIRSFSPQHNYCFLLTTNTAVNSNCLFNGEAEN